MNFTKYLSLHTFGLWAALLLVLATLSGPRQATATTPAAACLDGYSLWALNQNSDDTLNISGSVIEVNGATHSNADLRISGSNNRLIGNVEYVALFQDGGNDNLYPAPLRVAASPAPVSYTLSSYQPGGAAATVARNAGRYTIINGDMDVSQPTRLNGLYYVTGKAKLSASSITGTFTIVAADIIEVSGSTIDATAYAQGLLFFSGKQSPGSEVIKLAGSNNQLRGVIYGPGGTIEVSSSNSELRGSIIGDKLKLSGSNLNIRFDGAYCPTQDQPVISEPYLPDEVVVKLFNSADLVAVATSNGLNPTPLDQFGTRPIYRLAILDGTDPRTKAIELQIEDSQRVEYAEPNFATQSPEARRGRGSWVIGAISTDFTQQWAPTTIRLAEAHRVSLGNDVTVAVLDTGIDPSHPAFANRLVPGFDFVNFDNDPSEEGIYQVNAGFGHGTHVAGLISLVAPEAKIMPVRVLDKEGVGNIWVLSEGLLFAAERGPDGEPFSGDEAQVINLSLGTLRKTNLLEDLIREVTCSDDDDDDDDDETSDENENCTNTGGAVVIIASGNGGDTVPQYPAAEAVAGSLAVGASDQNDQRASFSTYGPWVRLLAPGDRIISTVPGGGYGTWSGTSMAAPLTAGTAALVRAAEPDLSGTAVIARIVERSKTICGPVTQRLDAAAAVGRPLRQPTNCVSTSNTYRLFLPGVMK
jgi:thermitase